MVLPEAVPPITNTYVEVPSENGPFGVKGIGEQYADLLSLVTLADPHSGRAISISE